MLAAAGKFLGSVWKSLEFTHPFIGPAFIGAVLSVSRSCRRKGFAYWASAVAWSTVAGSVLTPVFAHYAGIPPDVAGSSAALIAMLGHEGVKRFCREFEEKVGSK